MTDDPDRKRDEIANGDRPPPPGWPGRVGVPMPFIPGDPSDIRAMGWSVAVHNDYSMKGERFTFWLFTKGNQCAKGEGPTDAAALYQVRREILALDTPAGPGPGGLDDDAVEGILRRAAKRGEPARLRKAVDLVAPFVREQVASLRRRFTPMDTGRQNAEALLKEFEALIGQDDLPGMSESHESLTDAPRPVVLIFRARADGLFLEFKTRSEAERNAMPGDVLIEGRKVPAVDGVQG